MSGSAYSIDGRRFSFETSVDDAPAVGGYVTLTTPAGDRYLGQLVDVTLDRPAAGGPPMVSGGGDLLSRIDADGPAPVDGTTTFGDATLGAADAAVVGAHLAYRNAGSASLHLGTLRRRTELPATLLAKGFGRHTFMCGQSGSGKTYTLGAILERLLLETTIRMAVIDPNSDYVNLGRLRDQASTGLGADEWATLEQRYNEIGSRVHVFGGEGAAKRLRARYGRLSFQQQTMVLGLDPIADSEEYNAFVRTVRTLDGSDYSIDDLLTAVRASFDDDVRKLGLRIDNLGAARQSIWAGPEEPVMEQLTPDWRMIVADTGSLGSTQEGAVASAALLGHLWEQRRNREPILIVIDEAHNVCPQNPTDANQALATEHVVRIAGEGRKYGLYLLLSTQRPSKVHQNVLSQCENLLMMKMNSAGDIATLTETFSFVPAGLLSLAPGFGLGEGLAAGRIAPDPLLFKGGLRFTQEGGSDVSSSWASPG